MNYPPRSQPNVMGLEMVGLDIRIRKQNRAISLREAARLQTFPDDYEFAHPETPYYSTVIGRLIGNAVPIQLARVIARSIKNHLEMYASESKG